jgi:hypothetical protein
MFLTFLIPLSVLSAETKARALGVTVAPPQPDMHSLGHDRLFASPRVWKQSTIEG